MLLNKRGYTLTELIVVMAIFMAVIMITASAFEKVVTQSSTQAKSAETQIEGIVGLEVLRADLEQAGFGLPWQVPVSYTEAQTDDSIPVSGFWPVAGINSTQFNDDATSAPPRAILSGTTTFNGGSKYLVIKSMLAATNSTCKKWTTISYDKDGVRTRKVWGSTDRDLAATDQVIIVKNSLNSTPMTRQLMKKPTGTGTTFFGQFQNYSSPATHQNGDTYEIYGISPGTVTPSFPFNRAEYYVLRNGKTPLTCAANTGVLYKSVITQSGGGFDPIMPLLDCVADMEITYGLDNNGNGQVNQYYTAPANTVALTADDIRAQLREIRVYILAQEGKKDLLYSHKYPDDKIHVGETINGVVVGRAFNLTQIPGYQNYRWKVYTIVVRPKNLIQ
jgi:prepilin-type N-terminal cleavage/methylation domain-containing protein